jgi:hypothetical protein
MRDKFQSLGMDARAYYGNFLFSTGPNSEAGGSNNSQCHVDIPMAACSVSLDGEPITIDGDVRCDGPEGCGLMPATKAHQSGTTIHRGLCAAVLLQGDAQSARDVPAPHDGSLSKSEHQRT